MFALSLTTFIVCVWAKMEVGKIQKQRRIEAKANLKTVLFLMASLISINILHINFIIEDIGHHIDLKSILNHVFFII